MPYKKINYTIHCPKCDTDYQVLPQAYFRKMKDEKYGKLCKSCRAKVQWEEMNPEQKELMNQKSHEASKKRYESMTDEEKQDMINKRTAGTKRYWETMDDKTREEKSKKRSEDRKSYINSLSTEQLQEIGRKISETKLERSANMTEEELAERKLRKQKEREEYWNSLSKREKKRIIEILRDNNRKVILNMSDEERMKRSQFMTDRNNEFWSNKTKEERIELAQAMINGNKEWWDNLSIEDREKINDNRRENSKQYWDDLSEEEKLIHSKRISDYWNGLTNEEKANITKKILLASSGNNKFHQKFENLFNNSILINSYYLIPETILSEIDYIHSWDYGIYDKSNNELVAVVDLDGAYFHADSCDYDGLHSKEEYDEKRALSVPDGIKVFIIQEKRISKCFESMIQGIMLTYDEFIDKQFKLCRSMPFPYPKYSDTELFNSFMNLCKMNCDDKYHRDISLNTRVGDRLITNFHESIYQAHTKGNISPYEAWYDDDLLRKSIKNRIIYQNYLNPNKILQGFNIAKIATKVSVFSAGRAKMLINKYLSEYDTIFDPFSGFSGRMLGTISLGKRYIGQDISEIHVRESNNMIKFLTQYANINTEVTCKDILTSSGEYECLFTCPPYSDKEQWLEVPVDRRTCDDWIDICLNNFKCKKYLFVVDNTTKYKNNIVDEIKNKSHFNGNSEYVILIEK